MGNGMSKIRFIEVTKYQGREPIYKRTAINIAHIHSVGEIFNRSYIGVSDREIQVHESFEEILEMIKKAENS